MHWADPRNELGYVPTEEHKDASWGMVLFLCGVFVGVLISRILS